MALAAVAVPLAVGLGAAVTLPELAKEFKKSIEPKEVQEVVRRPEFKQIAQSAYDSLENRPRNRGLVDVAVDFLPTSPYIDPVSRQAFFEGAVNKAKALGYSDKEANEVANIALRTELYPGSAGELGALLVGSTVAEGIGREIFRSAPVSGGLTRAAGGVLDVSKVAPEALKAFNPLKNPVANLAVRSAFPAGFTEGAIDVLTTDVARRRFGSKGAVDQLIRVGAGGALGGVSAGVFAIPITGQSLSRKGVSKGSEIVGYLIDPLEYPGDVLQDLIARRAGIPQPRIRIPNVAPTVTAATSLLAGGSPSTSAQTNVQNAQQAFAANVEASQQSAQQTFLDTLVGVQQTGQGGQSVTNIPQDTFLPTEDTTPTDLIEEVPTDETTDTFLQTQQQQQQETPTDTETQTETAAESISANVNVPSPIFRGGLPLPPLFGGFPGGGSGVSRTGELLYFDEFGRAQRTLRRLL